MLFLSEHSLLSGYKQTHALRLNARQYPVTFFQPQQNKNYLPQPLQHKLDHGFSAIVSSPWSHLVNL
jgi:hypothetical protein